jgi:glycosyltransferase involved in cell wall biosynthesis
MMEQNPRDSFICLNQAYSTTRRIWQGSLDHLPDKLDGLFGGLRSRGYGKATSADAPLLTVVIPVRNGAKTLREAIRSVIQQSYHNIELIVIDGMSEDDSLSIIREFEPWIDLWISAPDEGVYDAMHKGVALASGEWLYFLGCDDVALNCFHLVAGLLQDAHAIYHGDVYSYRKNNLIGGPFSARKLIRKNIPHQAIFYPSSVFDIYAYDLQYAIAADYHLNVRCFAGGRYSFVHMPLLIAVYNDMDGLSSRYTDGAFAAVEQEFKKKHFSAFVYTEYIVRNVLRKIERRMKKLFSHSRNEKSISYNHERF